MADEEGWPERPAATAGFFFEQSKQGGHLGSDGRRGKAELPARPVLITVDDGFADFADNAMPALRLTCDGLKPNAPGRLPRAPGGDLMS